MLQGRQRPRPEMPKKQRAPFPVAALAFLATFVPGSRAVPWSRTFGYPTDGNHASALHVRPDGGLLVVGDASSQMLFATLDADGGSFAPTVWGDRVGGSAGLPVETTILPSG